MHCRPLSPAALRVAVVGLLAATAVGCAGTQKVEEVSWPAPPNKPRLKYVRSVTGAGGYDQRWLFKARTLLAGSASEDIVFNPNGVALSPDDSKLYVTSALGYVLRFDRQTTAVDRVAKIEGKRPEKPFALAVDASGTLYVTDLTGEVFVYSADDRFVRRFGRGVVERPTGIAVDSRRQVVYVVDGGRQRDESHKVEVFAGDGRHLRTIGARGTEPGKFLFPSFAAVSPDGDLYVADTMNSRIQVFDPDGNLVNVIGSLGDGIGQFAKPKGVAFDAAGNLHVVDGQVAVVQIFNRKNQVLMGYGGQGSTPEAMQIPNGIAISSKNEIFIADYAMNHVNEYLLFDTSEPEPPPAAAPGAAGAPTSGGAPAAAGAPAAGGAPGAPAPASTGAPQPSAAPAGQAQPAKP